jgi:Asp-tRNA(Asn)/Glu-tRNA(Gln) amidotransferase A subunit family amidase
MSEELTWLPAWRIRELIGKREVSAVEVTEHFLGRIEEFQPTLKAFIEVDGRGAREQAVRADRAVQQGDELGPLHGIPISVKEHILVAGLKAGGKRDVGPDGVSPWDDISVERLRAAGAVIVGTNSMLGSGGGATPAAPGAPGGIWTWFNWDVEARNPWDPSRVPGWSSSGGAAAAVAGLLPITIGSDGGGSTRLPAAYSGVVGMHPTRGLIPHVSYDRPRFALTGTYGPLARSVRDVAIATHAMAGPDGRDYVCIQADPVDYLENIDAGVERMRFAWTDDYGFTATYASAESTRIIDYVRTAAQGLRGLGATVESTDEVWEERGTSGGAEPQVYEEIFGTTPLSLGHPAPEAYRAAAESRQRNWERFRRLFRDHDLLLSVTAQRLASSVEEWNAAWTTDGASYPGGSFALTYISHTMMFNWLGFPAVSVPCGFVDGLPVGLQIVGPPGRDELVFRAASAFQEAFPRPERPAVS